MNQPVVDRLKAALSGREIGIQDETGRFAVLALLCEKEGELHLLFELRADSLRGQPGETCFPGGKIEAGERPYEAALRETFEEVNIPPEDITLIAPLDLIVDISNRVIYPFLGYVGEDGLSKLCPNEDEVKEAFLIPLTHLKEIDPYIYPAPVQMQIGEDFPYEKIGKAADYHWRGGLIDVPVYEYQGKTVWGMTARAVRSLLRLLREVEHE